MNDDLRLRPVRVENEPVALSGQEAMEPEGFSFLLGRDASAPWSQYVQTLKDRRCGINVVDGWVPSTFLFAVVGEQVVGRVSIRHELNEHLSTVGGHIGFGVLPQFRRRGYATEIFRQALVIARSLGIDRVLVTCDDDNVASAKTIDRCGGVFETTVFNDHEGVTKRRYWID